MWTFFGTTRSDISITPSKLEPSIMLIGEFHPSGNIPEADFINVSKSWLTYYNLAEPASDSSSNYGIEGTNLLSNARMNVVHPARVEGEKGILYYYDKCYYLYSYITAGTNKYHIQLVNKDSVAYNVCPTISNQGIGELTRDRVKSCSIIALPDSSKASGCGVCRTLWRVDLGGLEAEYSEFPYRYLLGPVIPDSLIQEWLKGIEESTEDAPLKPMADPEKADNHSATTAGWDWLNNFRIMNWTSEAWPERYLLDNKFYTDSEPFRKYMAFNDSNDPDGKYHINAGVGSIDPIKYIQKNINDDIAEWGSNISYYAEGTDANTGYFTAHNDTIDTFGSNSYQPMKLSWNIEVGELELDYTHQSSPAAPYSIDHVRFYTDNKYFSIDANYTLNWYGWMDDIDLSSPHGFGYGTCIVRRNDEYYLACIYKYGVYAGFAVYGQITNLTKLPNFDDGNPGDPKTPTDPNANPDGLNLKGLNDTFGTGLGTEPNPSTDSLVNNAIGDGTGANGTGAGTGSAYDGDGNPVNPGGGITPGTGEKNTNPVATGPGGVPNTHDGSMGNGTGNPHQGDTAITDPSSTLPSGVDSAGTVSGSGVLQVFTPTLAQLTTFTSELLSSTVLDSIKNFFTTNPLDGIFSLHVLPYSGFSGNTTANPRIGTHNFTAALTLAANEYINVDYGTVYIPFVYDGYENFAPASDVKIYLPFIGTKDIDINLIQGCQCSLKYSISLVTGDVYAYMYAQWASKWGNADTAQGVNHLIYQWQGNCASTIPLSHLDSTNYISGAMQVAGGITSLVAGAATANPFAIPAGIAGVTQGVAEMGRTSIITSGNLSGTAAFMACRQPFFIFSRPIIAFNSAYNHYLGQRSNAIEQIGKLRTGTFTKMRNVDLKGIAATSEELNEIDSIMKGGFYA